MLDEILKTKRLEIDQAKQETPLRDLLKGLPGEHPQTPSFVEALRQPQVNIIAEIKYRSPSHGPFKTQLPPQEVAGIYARNGASAISVLTDKTYFAGNLENLRLAAKTDRKEEDEEPLPQLPLLRKDFILDRYQVAEAAVYGASAYLLIVACLTPGMLHELQVYGREEYGLDALVEVHDPLELERAVESDAKLIGVNNRNLRTFHVDLDVSFDIAKRMEGEKGYTLVSESGISEYQQIDELRDAGYSAFLVGGLLMDSPDPGQALRRLRGEE